MPFAVPDRAMNRQDPPVRFSVSGQANMGDPQKNGRRIHGMQMADKGSAINASAQFGKVAESGDTALILTDIQAWCADPVNVGQETLGLRMGFGGKGADSR